MAEYNAMEQVREQEEMANTIGVASNTDPAHIPQIDSERNMQFSGIDPAMALNPAAAAPIPIPPTRRRVFVGSRDNYHDHAIESKADELYYKACSEHSWALDRPDARTLIQQKALPDPPPAQDPRQVMQVTTATGHDVRFLAIGDSYTSCLRAPTEEQCMPLFTVHRLPPNRPTPDKSNRSNWIGSDKVKGFHSYYKENHGTNKGHSVPYGDMSTTDSRKRTMEMLYNIYPTKRSVNSGNIQAVEKAIRKLADGEGGEGLVVYSGHIGVLHQRAESEYMPMYFYKILLRSPTFEPIEMGCILISNDAGEIAEARLPEGGKKPKWMGKFKNKAEHGTTRFIDLQDFFKWSITNFPDAITPQIIWENTSRLVHPFGLLQKNLTEVIEYGQGSPPAC